MKNMNLPNKLTVLRMALVPLILVVMLIPYEALPPINVRMIVLNVIAGLIFGAASLTDMLDGKIARKYGLVTDFGKFMDPLADKFMVISALFGLTCRGFMQGDAWTFWVFAVMLIVTIFRELAVTSIRMITAKNANIVVAADMLGKIKTVTQIICVLLAMVEPIVHEIVGYYVPDFFFYRFYGLTYLAAAVAIVFTLWSGINYLVSYWKYLDPEM